MAGCRLLRPVGSGAAADVWLAVDRSSGERVAVKVYRGADLPPGERLRVRHRHVVAVRRVVEAPPAVVLDLAAGGSLAGLVAARGPLDVAEVATLVVALAGALADLHAAGLVHGDVTPANVLFADGGRPLLGDLGDLAVAGAGGAVATAGYAAPEVVAGALPGPPSDVHGLCAVAWFALSGTVPDPVPPRIPLPLLAPAVPGDVAEVVAAGLDPDPAARPTPADLLAGMLAVAACEPVRLVAGAFPALPRDEAVTHRVPRVPDPADRGIPPPRRRWTSRRATTARRRGARLAAVALVGVLAGGALAATGLVDRISGTAAAGRGPGPAATGAAPPPATRTAPEPAVASGERLTEVVTELVAARQRALRSGDLRGLTGVYAAGSPALAADTAVLADHGPLAVTFEVLEVRPVEAAGDRITAVVRLATRSAPAATVVGGPVGPGVDTAAGPGGGAAARARVDETVETVRLTLVRAGGWRIDTVSGLP